MTGDWQLIETAPRDGSPIEVMRLYQGEATFKRVAAWRTVRFAAMSDPLARRPEVPAETATGWMYPNVDKRVPEPTHWRPA